MKRRRKSNRHSYKIIIWLVSIIVLVIFTCLVWHRHTQDQQQSLVGTSASTKKSDSPASKFNKSQYSINDSSSIWAVVNKGRILPSTYVPANLVVPNIPLRLSAGAEEMHLRADAASAMETMYKAAANDGAHLMLASGYRSYSSQYSLYNSYVRSLGQASADISSARAGHSEHQTGLAADLEPTNRACEVADCFANLPEGKWLAANAYKYGFIIRYPADKTQITGYEYEPWHVRYVGVALSSEMHQENVETLEEFFSLPAYTSYPTSSYQLM